MSMKTTPNTLYLAVTFSALNVAIGAVVAFFKLPIYLDTLGIVLSSILLGWRYGVLTGLMTSIVGWLLYSPYFIWYAGTSIGIALASAALYHFRMFDSLLRSCFSGLIVALVSALLSAPVTTWLGGNTFAGVDAITAFLLASGRNLWSSVFIAGLAAEPVDKVIVCSLAYLTVARLPKRLIEQNNLRPIPKTA